ncbi:hypothetical protein NDU88_010633 [Pleurodeles waltl]|uniref:Uncharacterized protein n=1 Tax=Pleurodeles waltl TaxID=8319 RepID=A0AAV7RZK6_PLEWA|nr:hypothetical protein NDU88_010633 [Pleurodeles waltl]
MSPGKSPGKSSGEATRQLTFLEAVSQLRPMSSSAVHPDPTVTDVPTDTHPDTAMERILQEISAVGHHLEAMNSKITDLSADSKAIRVDTASFQTKVTDPDHRLHAVEN